MKHPAFSFAVLAVALLILSTAASSIGVRYVCTALGTLGGVVRGINNAGQVVGDACGTLRQ